MLTKTNYLTYLQCPKAFWLTLHQPELKAPPDEVAQRRLQIGQQIDRVAQARFADGRLIPYHPDLDQMVAQTTQAIAEKASTLFQATIHHEDLLIRADILRRDAAGWHLIEVKSSTGVKPHHLNDVAFQVYALQAVGLPVVAATVLHLNKACRYPDLSNLFTAEDVTAQIVPLLPQVAADVAQMRQLAASPTLPTVSIGRHCRQPNECPFTSLCWQGVDGLTVFDISRLSEKKLAELQTADVLYVADVADTFALTPTQRTWVDSINQRQINIDTAAIRRELSQLTYPLYFFDFETIDYAVPRFDGCTPYQHIPFQYSCHVLEADGRLHHHQFLHPDDSDPRPALINALLNHIGETGSIIVYNATFERTILRHLADAFPAYAPRLTDIANRLWDQMLIFKKHYRDYRFGKSVSLKVVLPVVVPHLSYDALVVQHGLAAQLGWLEMVACEDNGRKAELSEQLFAYCHLDTLAMVEIHNHLTSQ